MEKKYSYPDYTTLRLSKNTKAKFKKFQLELQGILGERMTLEEILNYLISK